jgi:hypothetical protein
VNSKAYRAVSSAQSKKYFARKKSWSGMNSSQSAFLPHKKNSPTLPMVSKKQPSPTNNPKSTQVQPKAN